MKKFPLSLKDSIVTIEDLAIELERPREIPERIAGIGPRHGASHACLPETFVLCGVATFAGLVSYVGVVCGFFQGEQKAGRSACQQYQEGESVPTRRGLLASFITPYFIPFRQTFQVVGGTGFQPVCSAFVALTLLRVKLVFYGEVSVPRTKQSRERRER